MEGKPKRQIAFLVEIDTDDDFRKIRRFLKSLLRTFGIRCLSVRPAETTIVFKSELEARKDGRA